MTQREALLAALTDLPATSQELAIETGIPLRNVPVLLSRMLRSGQVQRVGTAPRSLVQYARA